MLDILTSIASVAVSALAPPALPPAALPPLVAAPPAARASLQDPPCAPTGAYEILTYPEDTYDEIEIFTNTITCSDGTTREQIEIATSTYRNYTRITYFEQAQVPFPPVVATCDPETEIETFRELVSRTSAYRYPDGACDGDDDCCTAIGSTTDAVHNGTYWTGPKRGLPERVPCPDGESWGDRVLVTSTIHDSYHMIKTTTFEPTGNCPGETCPDEVKDLGIVRVYSRFLVEAEFFGCDQ